MTDSRGRFPSPDLERLGERLRRYLLAVDALLQAVKEMGAIGSIGRVDIEKILQEILPHLCWAFDSESAFYTDSEGNLRFAQPKDSTLVGRTLPRSPRVNCLLEHGEPLVAIGDPDTHPELEALGTRSLLAVRLNVPWGTYLVGVCNGRDVPVYLGEDRALFSTFMSILEFGMRYGHIERRGTETRLTNERYLHAQRRGDWDFLSRASEDYASLVVDLVGPSEEREPRAVRLVDDDLRDDLLADYLDAELCAAMLMSRPLSAGSDPKDPAVGKSTTELPDRLLGLLEWPEGHQDCFSVHLHDNQRQTVALAPSQYTRTALAIARIGLWAGYIKANARVPEDPKRLQSDSLPQKLSDAGLPERLSEYGATELFHVLPEWLLSKTKPYRQQSKEPFELRRQIDWLRTEWQRMHYLARGGMIDPRRKWWDKIKGAWDKVYSLTAQILQGYLEDHRVRGEDLRINSDWLAVWLASNVLLSKRLAEYYGLKDRTAKIDNEKEQWATSPAERMQYITYLSQFVLYALHCARHLWREKEVGPRIQRPPFAEVPLSLSASLSEAQLYVLSEYAYHEIGINREIGFFARLTRQLRYEVPLYAASDFYRDHLYHVIDVCLLGELLLRSALPPDSSNATVCTLGDSFKNHAHLADVGRLLQNWYVAALCHDLGYVVEKTGDLIGPVRSINGPGLDGFLEAIEAGLESGREEIRQAVQSALPVSPKSHLKAGDVEAVAQTDHGIVAWLHLIGWLDQVKQPPESFVHALDAILRHNLPAQEVSIRREPLTLLLMLCDHLQEWGRPRVGPDPLAQKVMEGLRFSGQVDLEEKIMTRELTVHGLRTIPAEQSVLIPQACSGCLCDPGCKKPCLRIRTQVEEGGLTFRIRYVESREGNLEPVVSWLLLCRDLQCLGAQEKKLPYSDEGMPFPITIVLEHTPSWIWHVLSWKPLEMDLFQEFASTCGPAAYLCEWVQTARQEKEGAHYKEGIHYEGDRNTGVETFTIELHALGCPLPRGLSDKSWQQFIEWKWQRLGQQFINLSLGPWFPELSQRSAVR